MEQDETVAVEPGVHVLQIALRSRQEASADRAYERKGDLDDHERLAQT